MDVLTLALTSVIAAKFWCAFLRVQNRFFIAALMAAALAEALRRIVVARRQSARPRTFSEHRRFDLFAAILLAMGPWPIADVAGTAQKPLLVDAVHLPAWLTIAAAIGTLAIAFSRLEATLRVVPPERAARPIRHLTTVPQPHVASLVIVPGVSA